MTDFNQRYTNCLNSGLFCFNVLQFLWIICQMKDDQCMSCLVRDLKTRRIYFRLKTRTYGRVTFTFPVSKSILIFVSGDCLRHDGPTDGRAVSVSWWRKPGWLIVGKATAAADRLSEPHLIRRDHRSLRLQEVSIGRNCLMLRGPVADIRLSDIIIGLWCFQFSFSVLFFD